MKAEKSNSKLKVESKKSRGKSGSWFLRSLLVLVVLLGIFIATLPSLISTSWGKNLTVKTINTAIAGHVTIGEIRLSWLGFQEVKAFSLMDPDQQPVLDVEQLHSDLSLFHLVIGKFSLGQTRIIHPKLHLVTDQAGSSSLMKAIGASPSRKEEAASSSKVYKGGLSFPFTGVVSLEEGSVDINHAELDPVTLAHINAKIIFPAKDEAIAFEFKAQTKEGGVSGDISLQGLLQGLFSKDFVDLNANVEGTISNFPLAAADQFLALSNPKFKGLLASAVGSTLDATLNAHTEKNVTLFTATLKSAQASAEMEGQVDSEGISLTKPAQLALKLTPSSAARIAETFYPECPFTLTKEAQASIIVPVFYASFGEKDSAPTTFSLEVGASQLLFSHKVNKATVTINGFALGIDSADLNSIALQMGAGASWEGSEASLQGKVSVKGEGLNLSLKSGRFAVHGEAKCSAKEGSKESNKKGNKGDALSTTATLIAALGDTLSFDLSGDVAIGKEALSCTACDVKITTPKLGAGMKGALVKGMFSLTQPASIDYTISPELPEKLHLASSSVPKLAAPVTAALLVNSLSVQADGDILRTLKVVGSLSLPTVSLVGIPETINKFLVTFGLDGAANTMTLNGSGKIKSKGSEGSFTSESTLSRFITKEGDLSFAAVEVEKKTVLNNIPVSFVESLIQKKDFLSSLIGPTFDMTAATSVRSFDAPKGSSKVSIKSATLDASLAASFEAGVIKGDTATPLIVNWRITPEGFQALHQLLDSEGEVSSLSLKKSTNIKVVASSFSYPFQGGFSPSKSALKGSVLAGDFILFDTETKQEATCDNISVAIDCSSLADGANIDIVANVSSQFGGSKVVKGGVVAKGKVEDLFTKDGSVSLKQMTVVFTCQAKHLPVLWINGVLGLSAKAQQELSALLGSSVNADLNCKLKQSNGLIVADIKSDNFQVNIDGVLAKGGFTLHKPIKAQLVITKEVSEFLLDDVNPLLVTAVGAQSPVILDMPVEGFYLPFSPFDIKGVQVKKATITLNKIMVGSGGPLGFLVSFLKMGKMNSQDQMELWFTPIYVNVRNGIMTCERADALLAGTTHIATWGTVDLVQERVDMILGVDGSALKERLNVSSLPQDYMLQIPMRGPAGNVSINWAKATTVIAGMTAANTGIPQADWIGGILGVIGGVIGGDDLPVPPPTTTSFPWKSR